jgi:hypothetical protein
MSGTRSGEIPGVKRDGASYGSGKAFTRAREQETRQILDPKTC